MYSSHQEVANYQSLDQQTPRYPEPAPEITRKRYANLPVWQATSEILRITFDNFGSAMRLVLPWLFILCAVLAAVLYAYFNDVREINHFAAQISTVSELNLLLFGAAAFAATCFIGSNLAVKWHRYILLKDDKPLGNPFRLEGQSLQYFGLAVAVGIATMTLNLMPLLIPKPYSGGLAPIIILIVMTYLSVFFLRVSLTLPGIAVGNRNLRIADTLTCTKGSFWRILAVTMLLAICSTIMMWPAEMILVAGSQMGIPGLVVGIFGMLFVVATLWIIGITTLTVLYRYFIAD